MAERSIAAVLKTVEPSRVPGVRIPLPPLSTSVALVKEVFYLPEVKLTDLYVLCLYFTM